MSYTNYLGRNDLSRGLRNNNPGNLVLTNIAWQGKIAQSQNTDDHNPSTGKPWFEQFTQLRWGIRAMMKDIINDINKGTNTLRSLINEYAPPHENDTANYVSFVSGLTGIAPDVQIQLSKPVLQSIIRAKLVMENGWSNSDLVSDKDIADAFEILGINLPGSVIDTTKKKSGSSMPSTPSRSVCSHCSGTGFIEA